MYQTISDLDYFRMLVKDAQTMPLLESAIVLGRMVNPELDLQQVQADVDALAAQLAQACRMRCSGSMARMVLQAMPSSITTPTTVICTA
jgi:hypothetical protein